MQLTRRVKTGRVFSVGTLPGFTVCTRGAIQTTILFLFLFNDDPLCWIFGYTSHYCIIVYYGDTRVRSLY